MTIHVLMPSCRVKTEVSCLSVLNNQILQGMIFQEGEVLWCLFSTQIYSIILLLEKKFIIATLPIPVALKCI